MRNNARAMRVLVAFDKFKEALDAVELCAVVATALQRQRPAWEVECCPLADGGDGFARILTAAVAGSWEPCAVTGPRSGRLVNTACGFVSTEQLPAGARTRLELRTGRIGIVEMAAASGLALLAPPERDPWHTTSRGTGELLRFAAHRGADALLLGVGGSATHDLGLGALTALGWHGIDATGATVDPVTPANWPSIVRLEPGSERLPPLWIASDVDNPLLGPRGAAAVYATQKGAAPADLPRLEAATERMASLLEAATGASPESRDIPGTGAAGGIAYGLMLAHEARLVSGAELVGDWLELERRITAADLVLTGEGRFDASSLQGKGTGRLIRRALALGKHVHVFAGQIAVQELPPGVTASAISPADEPLDVSLERTAERLTAAVAAELPHLGFQPGTRSGTR